MNNERLMVIGIRPGANSIGPPGIHLRWSFPPHLGFPFKDAKTSGFTVYRMPSAQTHHPGTWLGFQAAPNQEISVGHKLQGATLYFKESRLFGASGMRLRVQSRPRGVLQLRFHQPVARFFMQLQLKQVSQPTILHAYTGDRLVDRRVIRSSDPTGMAMAMVSNALITDVTLQLFNVRMIERFGFITEAEMCEKKEWESLATLNLPLSWQVAQSRLETGLYNYYAKDHDAALRKYSQSNIQQLVDWVKLLQTPDSAKFDNPGSLPDKLTLTQPSGSPEDPSQVIRPQSLLLMAAMNPIIARFLSLYWVDQYNQANGPEIDTAYDYKIEAHYADKPRCGLLLDVGRRESLLPVAVKPVTGNQLPGIRWQGGEPLGRVGLYWGSPQEQARSSPSTLPIFYEVLRKNKTDNASSELVNLTGDTLVYVPASTWSGMEKQKALFVDSDVPIGHYDQDNTLTLFDYWYAVRGIDIFGQAGDDNRSDPVRMHDLAAPPPPVRLHARLAQPGHPWQSPQQRQLIDDTGHWATLYGRPIPGSISKRPAFLDMRFEYGAVQRQQAPDANQFFIYNRLDTLVDTLQTAVIDVVQTETGLIVTLKDLVDDRFLNGVFSNVPPKGEDGELPTAADRRRYRILEIVNDKSIRVDVKPDTQNSGQTIQIKEVYWLISDPHNIRTWSSNPLPVPIQSPTEGQVDTVRTFFQVTGYEVQPSSNNSLPSAIDVAEQPQANIVEIKLDYALAEPNLFAGGSAVINGYSYVIHHSTSGPAYSQDTEYAARIGLLDAHNLPPDPLTVSLSGAEIFAVGVGDYMLDTEKERTFRLPPILTVPPSYLVGGVVVNETSKEAFLIADAIQNENVLYLTVQAGRNPLPDNEAIIIVPPQVRQLSVKGKFQKWEEIDDFHYATNAPAVGGEIAFQEDGQPLRIAKVVTAVQQQDEHFELLIRTAGRTALDSIPEVGIVCRYYAPYIVRAVVDTAGASSGWLQLPLEAGQNKRAAYLAVATADKKQIANGAMESEPNISPLSTPVRIMAVQPPPVGKPAKPYPCGLDDNTDGYASPPDLQGNATVCLAWDSGDLTPTDNLRYEVARALDTTILATARRNWLQNASVQAEEPFNPGVVRDGVIEVKPELQESSGLWLVQVKDIALNGLKPTVFRNGRFIQNNHTFQITAVRSENDQLSLALRPLGDYAPTTGAGQLEAPPDGSHVRKDPQALRELAAQHEDAFGMATGVPIHETQFIDEIPGIGRNCYFYRVRAVDSAENRSDWSNVSQPFYQVNTTPPPPPTILQARGGERQVSITIQHDANEVIAAYHLYRALAGESLDQLIGQAPVVSVYAQPEGDQKPIRFKPLVKRFDMVNLNMGFSIPDAPAAWGVYTKDAAGQPDLTFNYFVSSPTLFINRQIKDLNPGLPANTDLTVILEDADSNTLILDHHLADNNAPLRARDQGMDLRFPYQITEIVGVYRIYGDDAFDFNVEPIDQPGRNYVEASSTYDMTTHVIENLSPDLEDEQPVIVITKHQLVDGTKETLILKNRVGTGGGLVCFDSAVALDMDFAPVGIVGVFRRDEYDYSMPPESQDGVNYVAVVSRYDPTTKTLKQLNPLLADGIEVTVTCLDEDDQLRTFSQAPAEILIVDDNLEGLLRDERYYYRLVAVKRVRMGAGDDQVVDIRSRPSELLALPVFDTTPPSPPDWISLQWWDETTDAPADINTVNPVARLAWQTPYPEATCTVFRRQNPDSSWEKISDTLTGTWDAMVNLNQFSYIDAAVNDASLATTYRLRIKNRLGRLNIAYAPATLEAKL